MKYFSSFAVMLCMACLALAVPATAQTLQPSKSEVTRPADSRTLMPTKPEAVAPARPTFGQWLSGIRERNSTASERTRVGPTLQPSKPDNTQVSDTRNPTLGASKDSSSSGADNGGTLGSVK